MSLRGQAVRYHTVIIGAGMSGLSAGIRLAYFDKPVCILERHSTIGGLNSFYRLRGRNYDVGLHAMTNFTPKGAKTGPLARIFKQLRLAWDDFLLVPQVGSAIVFPENRLEFTNDPGRLESQVAAQFPQEIDGFRRLTALVKEANAGDPTKLAGSARERLPEFIKSPLLTDMLLCPLSFYGSARPRDMDFGQFAVMFQALFVEGLARPYAGIRQILKILVRRFKALGGELQLHRGVQKILVDRGEARGVVLEDGTTIEADHVLSSAGSAETEALSPGALDPLTAKAGEISFTEAIHVLNREPAELGIKDTIVFYNMAEKFTYDVPSEPCDLSSGIICSPNNYQYEKPLEEGFVRITSLANPAYWMSQSEENYQEAKRTWSERILQATLQILPDFRAHVIDTDMFTPRTIKRFTGHVSGCVYGAPRKVFDGVTKVKNLFLCGTDQGYLGIVGSMLSGILMANMHLLRPDKGNS